MSDQHVQPLAGERQAKETDASVLACNDYLRLGIGRSLVKLVDIYRQQTDSKPPTVRERTLALWSTEFNWQGRAAAYDAQQDAIKTAEIARIKTEGLAAEHVRIRELSRLAYDLKRQIFYDSYSPPEDDDNVLDDDDGDSTQYTQQINRRPHLWVRDVKRIGKGDLGRDVDVYRYNSQIVSDYRGVLDDIAKEVGGRKERHELSGPDGGAIPLQHDILLALQEGYSDGDE